MEIWITAKEKQVLHARRPIPRPHPAVLERAGLSPEEVALVELFYQCPTPAEAPDSVRYAVWGLNYLPAAGRGFSPATYYGRAAGDWDTPASRIELWLGSAERAQAKEGGDEPRLFAVLRKLLAWCREYEGEHPYKSDYRTSTRHKTCKKARASSSSLVTVEIPTPGPEVTVRVTGEQLSLL